VLVKIGVTLVIIIAVIATYFLVFLGVFFPPTLSVRDMEKIYEKNQDYIQKIVGMLRTLDFNSVGINKSSNTDYQYIVIYDSVPVEFYAYENDEVFLALQNLFNRQNCYEIEKNKNYIFFKWWAILDASCGIVYSLDGETPKMFEELGERNGLEFEPLGYDNWYYYYHNIKHKVDVNNFRYVQY